METKFRPVGFNIGGWVSQSPLTPDHLASFIGPGDFKAVAGWGFNSIRLPVDGHWLFKDGGAGPLNPESFRFLTQALQWAWDAGLHVVFDLHSVPWHSFAKPEMENLWRVRADLDAFCGRWAELASALKPLSGPLWLDILNEPTAKDPADWHRAAGELVRAIRSEDGKRTLVVESTLWGSVTTLERLVREVSGEGLVYSFHTYDPMYVTHQGAPWCRETEGYKEQVPYPGPIPKAGEYLEKRILPPLAQEKLAVEGGKVWNRDSLSAHMGAVERLSRSGMSLYCGEFGVYQKAPRGTRLEYISDVVSLFKGWGVGWAYWNYKWLDFGIFSKNPDGTTAPADTGMVKILQQGI